VDIVAAPKRIRDDEERPFDAEQEVLDFLCARRRKVSRKAAKLLDRRLDEIEWCPGRIRRLPDLVVLPDGLHIELKTLGDLINLTPSDLSFTCHLGPKALTAIVQTLHGLGLSLAPEPNPPKWFHEALTAPQFIPRKVYAKYQRTMAAALGD